jgi:hypothetical protein
VTLFKIIGAALIVLGMLFRAISVAYFKAKAPHVNNTLAAQRGFAASKRRALYIDIAFFIAGIIVLLGR